MALFQLDHKHKFFIITLGGFAASEQASNFVDALKKEVSKIDVNQFTLVVDSTELRTFRQEILPVLEQSYALYMTLGFKKILMIKPSRVTPRLQLKRIAKNVHFTGTFIGSMQDAIRFSEKNERL